MQKEQNSGYLRSRKLLLVDDDVDLRETLKELLITDGALVECARSVDEATALLKVKEFDLILSDMQMPLKSGLTLLKWCQKTGVYTDGNPTPFIFFTGHGDQIDEENARALGACAILSKPMSHDLLVAELQKHLPIEGDSTVDRSFFFSPIPSVEFQEGKDIRFPIYAIFGKQDNRYHQIGSPIRIGASSATIPESHIEQLLKWKTDSVYIRVADAYRFYGFSSKVDTFSESEIVEQQKLYDEIFEEYEALCQKLSTTLGVSGQVFRYSTALGESALKLIMHSKELQPALLRLRNEQRERYLDCVASGVLSVATMTLMGWESLPVRVHVAFSAILIELYKARLITSLPRDMASCVSTTVLGTSSSGGNESHSGKFKVPPLVSIIQSSRILCEYIRTKSQLTVPELRGFVETKYHLINRHVCDGFFEWLSTDHKVKNAA